MSSHKIPHDPLQSTFAERIKLLIQRVGSATEIARMCGFSEGVVRSWRDGHTDPSRARCVTLARTLGISLVWLVAGEGALQIDPTLSGNDDNQLSSETTRTRWHAAGPSHTLVPPTTHADAGVDPHRLNTAMQILQSELQLAGSNLTLADNTDLLSELYEVLGSNGENVNAMAMLKFNRALTTRILQAKQRTLA
ncbi:MAG: XRE family transcriptional regulator [Rhodanobacter sp.]|nr:MAG: XRE family transcriptional regulator [Rhodanobacter sp.]TAM15248.1 MAG: XRE family transcriptional regulator [Rhodanobacter sp.]TAM34307.1 MAG: XRE family transcriptional regulator [Rhodanobacter sp.]